MPAHLPALWCGGRPLQMVYSQHAIRAATSDRYGHIPLYREYQIEPGDVVEVTVENGVPVKAVVRVPLSQMLDVVLVLNRPERFDDKTFVRTVWLNLSEDNHTSLRRDKYVRP
jgi:hypothetical protein